MDALPRTISKSELIHVLQCYERNGSKSYRKLRKHFLTERFVEEVLKLDWHTFRNVKRFDAYETKKIFEAFDIDAEEYHQAFKPQPKS